MSLPLGETAALITAACYTASSTFFTRAGQTFGSWVTNRARLVVAVMLLVLVHWVFLGQPLPLDAPLERWLWLGASGIVGLVLGDLFLFQAYIWIGARLGLLLLSLAPVLATLLAWLFLGEVLSPLDGLGMAATLGGIAWVILEPGRGSDSKSDKSRYLSGVLMGFLAAAGQAGGLVLAKKGLGGDFPALSANVMRMSVALLALWTLTLLQGQIPETIRRLSARPTGLKYILAGSVIGPLAGVSFSLYAIQHTSVGVASTLIALPPVFFLPVAYFVLKERFGWGAVAGTVLALGGVALLFLF
jgi:drug/metabolite transporter (DMT)-like permease